MKAPYSLSRMVVIMGALISNTSFAHTVGPNQTGPAPQDLPPTATRIADPMKAGAVNAVINGNKLWRAGSTLAICFQGGTVVAKQMLVDAAREWGRYVSLSFDPGQPPQYRPCNVSQPSHIRVSFASGGSSSMVGIDSVRRDALGQPSLNIDIGQFGDIS